MDKLTELKIKVSNLETELSTEEFELERLRRSLESCDDDEIEDIQGWIQDCENTIEDIADEIYEVMNEIEDLDLEEGDE